MNDKQIEKHYQCQDDAYEIDDEYDRYLDEIAYMRHKQWLIDQVELDKKERNRNGR